MTVKEIVKETALLLDREDIIEYLESGKIDKSSPTLKDSELLVNCYNYVAEELATYTFKLRTVESFIPIDNVVEYKNFSKNPLAIISIKNENGEKTNSKIYPVDIKTKETRIIVEYYYIPDKKELNETIEFENTPLVKRIISLGMVVEYLLIKGMYVEASIWNDKYDKSLKPFDCRYRRLLR